MRHTQRLQKLIDLTSTNDNSTYLYNQLQLLEQEIKVSILDAKIEVINNLKL